MNDGVWLKPYSSCVDGKSDYGFQMKVWHAAPVFNSMHRSRLVAKAGGVLGVKLPFSKFSTRKQFHRIYFGGKSETCEDSIKKTIHNNKQRCDWQRARASKDTVCDEFTRTQRGIMPVTALQRKCVCVCSLERFGKTFGVQ